MRRKTCFGCDKNKKLNKRGYCFKCNKLRLEKVARAKKILRDKGVRELKRWSLQGLIENGC